MDLHELERIVRDRAAAAAPDSSYTAKLLHRGLPVIARKVIEEAGEVVGAAIARDADHVASETADLFYHTLVLLHEQGVALDDVMAHLAERHRRRTTPAPSPAPPPPNKD